MADTGACNGITKFLKEMHIGGIYPSFEVHLPNSKFKKSSPGDPNFLLCLLRYCSCSWHHPTTVSHLWTCALFSTVHRYLLTRVHMYSETFKHLSTRDMSLTCYWLYFFAHGHICILSLMSKLTGNFGFLGGFTINWTLYCSPIIQSVMISYIDMLIMCPITCDLSQVLIVLLTNLYPKKEIWL
jgi:hypothetical protein